MIKIVLFEEHPPRGSLAIAGFPGMGLVGKTVAEYLIRKFNAKHIASVFCTGFPAHLIVRSGGSTSLIKVDVYYVDGVSDGIFIVTSDAQPMEDVYQNELSHTIVAFLKERGVKEVLAGAAYVTESIVASRRVFVAGSQGLVRMFMERVRAIPLEDGVISGMNGVIVGWAQVEGLSAACILGETWRSIVEFEYVDYGAAKVVLDAINAVYDLNLDTSELADYASRIESEVMQKLGRLAKASPEDRGRSYYIT